MIYIDSEFKCHAAPGDGLRGFEVPYFDGKCEAFVDGYRYVPEGESWQREDGVVFTGEMLSPWQDYAALNAKQREYEKEELDDALEALKVLGVNV